ncbi:AraC-like DNA-binding protein [Chitinophaga niastensis]|uniref:AraC-like DNA-binding protein n=1 Tax=Chitinophaga niastensis TaxID=536980 RepID=A0A2P8HUC6_CHINA|nr:AraC family transcriptional regulator [Chitinophaga niastensis]PSL49818.1 AraC-like DNA-binding protein [Chitinophaga niastensis]
MYTLYNSFALQGQHHIETWQQQGRDWAAYSRYRQQAVHELYIPHTVLNLVIQGEKRMYDGSRVHHLYAGDVLLIPAGSLLCSEILRPQKDYRSINLVLPDDMILADRKAVKNNVAAYTKSAVTLPRDERWHTFAQLLLQHFAVGETRPPDYYDIISQTLDLVNKNEHISAMLHKTVKYPLPQVMETLCTDLHEVRLLEEVAAMGHMSTATLKRRFREVYQCSPMHWIWEKRLQMACFLLRTTAQPIPEIAYSTGFENLTHFYRQFRKSFHVTPLQWRKAETELFSK